MSMQSEGNLAEYPAQLDPARLRPVAVLLIVSVGAALAFIPLYVPGVNSRLATGLVGVGTSILAAGLTTGLWISLEVRPQRYVVVYKNCDAVPWARLVSAASESLQISGISLTKPLVSFVDENRLSKLTQRASLHIELLFCDPRSPYLESRASVENSSLDTLVRDQWCALVRSCLLAQMFEERKLGVEQVEIHLLNGILACTTFRSDSELVSGPYLSCGPGTQTFRVRVSNSDSSHVTSKALFEQLKRDFERVFRSEGVRLVSMRGYHVTFNWNLVRDLGWLPPDFKTPASALLLENDKREKKHLLKAQKYLEKKYREQIGPAEESR